jgi:Zn-dependent protease with chaperone function
VSITELIAFPQFCHFQRAHPRYLATRGVRIPGMALAGHRPMFMEREPASVRVARWPTERPMFIVNTLAAAALWAALFWSRQSLAWAAVLFGFFALMNLMFIAQIRGSAVRLGPEQFPDLYARVVELARLLGLRRVPDVYLMQQDGALNALATRFLRSHIVVLYSDLLEACGDNHAARDMIIGHELGHIRAGHLLGRWCLMPVSFVPFVGSALSRAREYTADRYGAAAAGDRDGALLGLTLLAAGGKYGPLVNRAAVVRQRLELGGGLMIVGEWLGSHPPLAKRLIALSPELDVLPSVQSHALLGWLRPVFAVVVVIFAGYVGLSGWLREPLSSRRRSYVAPPAEKGIAQVHGDLQRLNAFIEADVQKGQLLPWDHYDLYGRWAKAYPDTDAPWDPFNGYWYEYDQRAGSYRLSSAGPDGRHRTDDDIVFDSRSAASN